MISSGELEKKVTASFLLHEEFLKRSTEAKVASKKATELESDKSKLLNEIAGYLRKGTVLSEDLALDYCIIHFVEKAYEKLPLVEKFAEQIKESKGQRILKSEGEEPSEVGTISRASEFIVENRFRHLYVPVENYQVVCLEKWEEGEGKIYVPEDIFSYLAGNPIDPPRFVWQTDHPEGIRGGPRPKETRIYIGDSQVGRALKKYSVITLPATKRKISPPRFKKGLNTELMKADGKINPLSAWKLITEKHA